MLTNLNIGDQSALYAMNHFYVRPSLRAGPIHICGHEPDLFFKDFIDPFAPLRVYVRKDDHVLVSFQDTVPVEIGHSRRVEVIVLKKARLIDISNDDAYHLLRHGWDRHDDYDDDSLIGKNLDEYWKVS